MTLEAAPLGEVARQLCQEEGCTEMGVECFLPTEVESSFWYCWKHARDQGFCPACGQFWGGVESFEFGTGLCDNCEDALDDDDYEDEDYDEEDPLVP